MEKPTFKKVCLMHLQQLTNFPYIEKDFDAITDYELLCRVVKHLNDTIKNQEILDTSVINLYNAFNELKNYVDKYFDDLDISAEVNEKLDEMAQDGTLDEIINQHIFEELNDKINNLEENLKYITYNKIFVGTFFDTANEKVHFLTSLDGQNWSEFNKNVSISGRDPQLIYNKNNKTFYLSLTQSSGVNYDFICYTSTDFINWTQHQVDLGIHSGLRWAPELFIDDNGIMYATISNGNNTSSMQVYIAECNDIENLSFNNARVLNLQLANVIDANIMKYNGLYYLTVKNENTAKIYIYTSPDLVTFTQVNTDVIGYDVPCEGGQLLNINNRWYFYGDTWQSYRYYGLMQTNNINDFGFLIVNNSLKELRHGSVLYLEDKEAINLITSLEDYTNVTNIKITESQIILEGTYENLVVHPNTFYRISGSGVTINKLENPYNLEFMPFCFTAGSSATFTFTNKSNKTYTIQNSPTENEKLQLISLQGDQYLTGRVKKTISASDLWTINDPTQHSVTLYTAILAGNTVHLVFTVRKLVSAPSVQPFTLKAPYRPIGVCPLNNDKGKAAFIRNNGTTNLSNVSDLNVDTYCYCSFNID